MNHFRKILFIYLVFFISISYISSLALAHQAPAQLAQDQLGEMPQTQQQDNFQYDSKEVGKALRKELEEAKLNLQKIDLHFLNNQQNSDQDPSAKKEKLTEKDLGQGNLPLEEKN